MRDVNIKTILLVTLAVFGIDFITSTLVFGAFTDLSPNATPEQIKAALPALYADAGYLTWTLLLGTASTVVGGYLTARLVRTVPYFNALAFGVLGVLVGVLIGILVATDMPAWLQVLGNLPTIPAALLGAYLRIREQTKTPDQR